MTSVVELHPLCTLFPRITGNEFIALVEDITQNGLREPIVLRDGMILDGGNRYRACIQAGVEPKYTTFEGDGIVAFVLSKNLHRRHMSAGQQAAIVASAQDWAKAQAHGGDRRSDQSQVVDFETVTQRASVAGVSRVTQMKADRVAREAPDLAMKVAHGETTLPKAVEQITGKTRKPPPGREKRTLEPEVPEEFRMTAEDDLKVAQDAITELSEENDRLKDRIGCVVMEGTDEERQWAAGELASLRQRVKVLEAENEALKSQRDQYMVESAEKTKQILYWKKAAERVAA